MCFNCIVRCLFTTLVVFKLFIKIEFYLSALKQHLAASSSPESKLSVIYQYLYLAGKEKKNEKQVNHLRQYRDQLKVLIKVLMALIPASEILSMPRQKLLNSFKENGALMIPKAYFSRAVIDFSELSVMQREKLNKGARSFIA